MKDEKEASIFCPHNRTQVRSYARAVDPGAGIEIQISNTLPPLVDILGPFLDMRPQNPDTDFFQGRFMIQQLRLQDAVILIAPFYGIAQGGLKAGRLLALAHETLRAGYAEVCAKHSGQEVCVVMLGDFNAFPFHCNDVMYEGAMKQCDSAKTLNHRSAMTQLLPHLKHPGPPPLRTDVLRFSHVCAFPSPPTAYHTNITTRRRGRITKTGIDHILVSAQHAPSAVTRFEHLPLSVAGPLKPTAHHILSFDLAGFWIRPLKGLRPKSAFRILPSFVFHQKECCEEVADALDKACEGIRRSCPENSTKETAFRALAAYESEASRVARAHLASSRSSRAWARTVWCERRGVVREVW